MWLTLDTQRRCYQPWARGTPGEPGDKTMDLEHFSARIRQRVKVTEGEGMKTLVRGQLVRIRSRSQLKFVCVCV